LLLPNYLLSTEQSIRLHPGETAQSWHTDDPFYLAPHAPKEFYQHTAWGTYRDDPKQPTRDRYLTIFSVQLWGSSHRLIKD
jgi:hypothetical protein